MLSSVCMSSKVMVIYFQLESVRKAENSTKVSLRMRGKLKRNLFLEMKQRKSLWLWKAQLNPFWQYGTNIEKNTLFFILFINTLKTVLACSGAKISNILVLTNLP